MTKILGKSLATAKQMSEYLLSKNKAPKFSRNISALDFCQLFLDICAKEDVRGDIAFAQSCKETANFKYGGDVKYTQNNFAGIGATGNGVCGCVFSSIEEGILAQAQHLKTYATKDALNERCVDPRRTTWFVNTKGGTSPDVEGLASTWAVPGYNTKKYSSLNAANAAKDSYGYQIVNILNDILKIKTKEDKSMATKKIGIDRGHGLRTSGKQTPNGIKEWSLNDAVADLVVSLLKDYDVEFIHTDNDEGYVDEALATRRTMYVNQKVDAFVSIHHNASSSVWANVTGVEIYTDSNPTAKDVSLANAIYRNLPAYTGLRGRGIKKADFAVINQNAVPAVLVEGGFMNGKNDYEVITSAAGQMGYARAVAEGLINFLGLTKKNTSTNSSTSTSNSTTTTSTTSLKAGDKLVLNSHNMYSSATTSTATKKTGTYYVWSNEVVNGRIRITNAQNRVGVAGQVSGWVNVSDFKSTTTTSATVTKTGYDLIFDATYYANNHADLKAAFGTNKTQLLNHFKNYGMKEGRKAISTFDVKVYKENNADLQKAFGDDYIKYFNHYMTYGHKENRKTI
jgi:N-acetylmuramoyl-L-alanine amidase